MPNAEFVKAKEFYGFYLSSFLSYDWFNKYASLGFNEVNPKEKDINSLT